MPITPNWFVLRCRPRREKFVSTILQAKGFEQFLPLYKERHRWADRMATVLVPLFPGYLFCRFSSADYLNVVNTPSVVEVLGNGRQYIPVPDKEISDIRHAVESGLTCEPWQTLVSGEPVRIVAGPFAGHEGTVAEIRSSSRLVLSVTLLQRSVLVTVDPDWVDRLSPASVVRSTPATHSTAQK